jgi:asparagine synthase (glutamine-hydrolysing)
MASADEQVWLVYNGEIYNHQALRSLLTGRGHRFRSQSDTEVLLHAYLEWGEACVAHLNGMYAFCILDLRLRRAVLARDPSGVKPLYYAMSPDGEALAFASEIKAITVVPSFANGVDDRVMRDYLVAGTVEHGDRTFYSGIKRLSAGQTMTWDKAGVQFRSHTHKESSEPAEVVESVIVARTRELVTEAVRLRMRSDVPLGFCLSGGVDSGSIVATANEIASQSIDTHELKAFTMLSTDAKIDEGRSVRLLLQRYPAVSPMFVTPTASEFVRDYPRLLQIQDEPFGGASVYCQFRVFELAKSAGMTVVIDGQGGDELFCGYYRYLGARLLELIKERRWRNLVASLGRGGAAGVRHLVDAALRPAFGDFEAALRSSRWKSRLIEPAFSEGGSGGEKLPQGVVDLAYRDFFETSLPKLLRFEDRNSMAVSIESRVPFADDRDLIAFMHSQSSEYLVKDGWTKYVLRAAMNGRVPAEILWQTRKIGFAAPDDLWAHCARRSTLWEMVLDNAEARWKRSAVERYREEIPAAFTWRLLESAMLLEQVRNPPVVRA